MFLFSETGTILPMAVMVKRRLHLGQWNWCRAGNGQTLAEISAAFKCRKLFGVMGSLANQETDGEEDQTKEKACHAQDNYNGLECVAKHEGII